MPAPVWLHCGDCSTQGTGRWFLSSCGRIVCSDCHPQLRVNHCNACRGPCSRTVELTPRAPTEVKNLFADPSNFIKPISKMIDFQEKNKRRFLAIMTKRLADLDAKHQEFLRQKEERLVAIEKAKARLAQLHREIDEKKQLIKKGANAPTDWNNRDRPASQSSLYNLQNISQSQDMVPNFFSTPMQHHDETYGVNDGGFLQLKTPGVFHGDKDDDHKIKDPAKRRKKASSTGSNVSFEKTPLREKIRQKQRDKLLPSFFSPTYDKYDPNN